VIGMSVKRLCFISFLLVNLMPMFANSFAGQTKNVILIIGDGMGPQQIGLLEAYATQAQQSVIKNRVTAFNRLLNDGGVLGISMTASANVLVADSASSATQLATGKAAGSEMLGIDVNGASNPSILDIAKKMGKSTGLVSDVRITHATPAAFAAHQPHRSMENAIALDMLVTAPDVMLSGGLRHWIPQQANDQNSEIYKQLKQMTSGVIAISSKRTDDLNLLTKAQSQGYQLAFTQSQLQNINGKVLGLFGSSALPDALAVKKNHHSSVPSLKEMSAKAIEILSKNDNGFFLMIEAGMLDWAGHYNDTGTLLHELLKINGVLEYVLDWAQDRDDTFIIVTADHETGGFGFTNSGANLPKPVKFPGTLFPENKLAPALNFGNSIVLDKLYNQKSSYTEIFSQFDSLAREQKTPLQLMNIINQQTDFSINETQAERILETEKNPLYLKGHKYLGSREVPRMSVNDAFFFYQTDDNRQNLLAIEVAVNQSVTWSNGGHTATPVLVFVKGSEREMKPFSSFMHHTDVGRKAIDVLKNNH